MGWTRATTILILYDLQFHLYISESILLLHCGWFYLDWEIIFLTITSYTIKHILAWPQMLFYKYSWLLIDIVQLSWVKCFYFFSVVTQQPRTITIGSGKLFSNFWICMPSYVLHFDYLTSLHSNINRIWIIIRLHRTIRQNRNCKE